MKRVSKHRLFYGGWTKLSVAVAVILIIWLIGLPWLANRALVRNRIDWLAEEQIDPTAMFYTELESMDSILRKIEREP